MNAKQLTRFLSTFALLAFFGLTLNADEVLIDRPPIVGPGHGMRNQQYPDFPDFSIYVVANAIFDTNVELTSITTYFTNVNQTWPESASAILNIYQGKLGDDDDPLTGMKIDVLFKKSQTGLDLFADLTGQDNSIILQRETQYWIIG